MDAMNKPDLAVVSDLPDVASRELMQPQLSLDWVGMSNIHQPLLVQDGERTSQVQTKVQVYVDLADCMAKGIHMSRLYLILDEHAETRALTAAGLKLMLASLLESHRGLSSRAFLQFEFDYYLRRQALVSEFSGWNSYPVTIKGTLMDGEMHLELGIGVYYSSTCPCSAALARQLIQNQFQQDFGSRGQVSVSEVENWLGTEQGIVATPHSQRSLAHVLVKLEDGLADFPITDLIDRIEDTLKTPVQTAVKREDEQEFARLNGQNLMFIEDSGRELKALLQEDERLRDFWVRVEHHESLHAHDAVGIFTKGVEKGYLPIP
ncbi:MAG: GTP cyclohydrolase FolE2 [Pseudomonadales bacterium]|jgi:GTP cyclohydrolase I|nr:GTP cyclohydrolase FolE2 [Pseudomonadales bacterium]MDP6469568.1 GTP cyclohydrolase FolE2 [Pseudomonadales bacterium]MDP6827409.1 GTP cyclohydrolase FolE2 [Pseudomonadales bacterium]MDP6971232.1 GTP cyclohydrolase FolE2 [Pseudomonadales bacterium]|tara:strand:- start:1879 stop:2838 length:960 start_codon:yes stop_codon:yes gene_type:complete